MILTKQLTLVNLFLFLISLVSLTYLSKYYFITIINLQLFIHLTIIITTVLLLMCSGILIFGDSSFLLNFIIFFFQILIIVVCCHLMDSKAELFDIFYENEIFSIHRKWSQKELNQICREYFAIHSYQWNFTTQNRLIIVEKVWNNTKTYSELVAEINQLVDQDKPMSYEFFQFFRWAFTNPAALNIMFAYTVVLLQYFLWLPPN